MKKNTHGGKRKGSGRKKKPPTKTLSYRVPLDKAELIDQHCRRIIEEIKNSIQKNG